MASFKTLSQADIDEISAIMDVILQREGSKTNNSVKNIRREYHLSSEQYNMAYDLCMPMIRKMSSNDGYWKLRYGRLRMRISAVLRKDTSETAEKVRKVLITDTEQVKKINENTEENAIE